MATMIDSAKQQLNIFNIVHISLADSAPTPEIANDPKAMAAELTGVTAELNQPDCKTKQFGNTFFAAHVTPDHKAFVRAFNADIAKNFIKNMKAFILYAYHDLGIDVFVIPGLEDPKLNRLLTVLMSNPPQQDMSLQTANSKDGQVMAVMKLGPQRT